MIILAVETSCDETAIATIDFNKRTKRGKMLANLVSSQIEIHKPFGGVVPNLARREHEKNLVPILIEALEQAKLIKPKLAISDLKEQKKSISRTSAVRNTRAPQAIRNKIEKILERESELQELFIREVLPIKPPKIEAIAVTYGPGLAPALWVGVNFARALSYVWKRPLIPVNHMEGHIFSALIEPKKYGIFKYLKIKAVKFPALALLVSGGHTELVLIKKQWRYKIVGETVDDAAGEAFDKVARILDLPYPGGPEISALAEKVRNHEKLHNGAGKFKTLNSKFHIPNSIRLPRPMINSKDFNFSFSGLKTAVLYLTRDLKDSYLLPKVKAAIAKEFQDAVVEVLVAKTIRAARKYNTKTILLGGGVAANKALRKSLASTIKEGSQNSTLHVPDSTLTGDNALMIAAAAALTGKERSPHKVVAEANLRFRS